MTEVLRRLGLPVIISLGLVIPFMVMELVNRPNMPSNFPVALFVVLWLLPLIFILVSTSTWRSFSGKTKLTHRLLLLLRMAFLVVVAIVWVNLVVDQMPCFLGVPNCD